VQFRSMVDHLNNTVPPLGWVCIGVGMMVAQSIVGVLVYDPYAIATIQPTVSSWTCGMGRLHHWFSFLVSFVLMFLASTLDTHLFHPRSFGPADRESWTLALVGMLVAIAAGIWAGSGPLSQAG